MKRATNNGKLDLGERTTALQQEVGKTRRPDATEDDNNSRDGELQPTKAEAAALVKFLPRIRAERSPRLKLLGGKISPDHSDKRIGQLLLMRALGTADTDFFYGLLEEIVTVSLKDNRIDEVRMNFALSIVKRIKPNDELEAMLASQMAAIHINTMSWAHRLATSAAISEQEIAERTLNKLARTFATQLEALKRYREQTLMVQRVSVVDRGQTVVMRKAVSKAPEKTLNTSSLPIADALAAPMAINGEHKEPAAFPPPQAKK